MSVNYFLSSLILQTAIFQNKLRLRHIKLKIYIWKTKFTSHKWYLFSLLPTSNTKRTDTDRSILPVFNSVWKEMSHKPLKAAAAKNFFPNVYVIRTFW